MKSVFIEKSLGVDIRENDCAKAIDRQRRKGRKIFPQQGQPLPYRPGHLAGVSGGESSQKLCYFQNF